jgi:hypothetical protein
VGWLRRAAAPPSRARPEPDEAAVEAVESAAPGVAALLEGVSEDGSHAVLDLGLASPASLAVYERFARHIRFADVAGLAISDEGHATVQDLIDAVPARPQAPYDLIFAWNVLDRLSPEDRPPLVARLAEVSAPRARLHMVIGGVDQRASPHLRYSLLGTDRMSYEPAAHARPARSRLLPAQVAHLLIPFRVQHGFTLRAGLREYVAFREADGVPAPPPSGWRF